MSPTSTHVPTDTRLLHVDGLRGLAALAVTWFHLTLTHPAGSPVRGSGHFGFTGVQMFFVISGFILPWTLHDRDYRVCDGFARFMAKRLLRIEPPYLASVAIVILLAYASHASPWYRGLQPDFTLTQIAAHLGYVADFVGQAWLNDGYWTLAIEFQFYILLGLTYPVWRASTSTVFYILTTAIALCGTLTPTSVLLAWWTFFALGLAAYRLRRGLDTPAWALSCAATFLSLAALRHGAAPAVAAGLAWAVLCYPAAAGSFKALARVGTFSFSMYLLHAPIGGRIVNLMTRAGDSQGLQVVASLLGLAASIGAAWLFWRYIERPASRAAQRIRLGRSETIAAPKA